MRKYAVLGNCVTRGVTRCVQFFEPKASVAAIPVWEVPRRFGSADELLSHLSKYDVVFLFEFNEIEEPFFWGCSAATIVENCPQCIVFPKIVFAGYHPDQVYAFDQTTGASLSSPLPDCHSAIALYGYIKGFASQKIRSMYCTSVFECLGYFRAWEESAIALVAGKTARSFKLSEHLLSWAREGCFMHNIIHPKITVLADIAREMMIKAGCRPSGSRNIGSYVPDDLLDSVVWPVYPEIGLHYNIPGAYIFKLPNAENQDRRLIYLDLDDFINLSLEGYARYSEDQIRCDRIQEWLQQSIL